MIRLHMSAVPAGSVKLRLERFSGMETDRSSTLRRVRRGTLMVKPQIDIAATLRERPPGTHLYYCGPAGMMAAAAAAARHWPPETVHCEYFAGPNAVPPMLPE